MASIIVVNGAICTNVTLLMRANKGHYLGVSNGIWELSLGKSPGYKYIDYVYAQYQKQDMI